MSGRAPTEKQYGLLRTLGSGATLVCGGKRQVEPLLRRGWVTATHGEDRTYPYSFVRITPDGLRALAQAVERYGLPELGRKLQTEVRVCSECGSDRYRIKVKTIKGPAA